MSKIYVQSAVCSSIIPGTLRINTETQIKGETRMRKMLTVFMSILALSSFIFGGWEFDKIVAEFPDEGISNSWGMHAVAVDGAGNIWYGMYGLVTDSVANADGSGSMVNVYEVFAIQPDGTPLSFSPISMLTIGAATDTLTSSAKGMATDNDGNILHAVSGKLYKINHTDGTGMAMYDFPDVTGSLTKPAVDDAGNIYIGTVGKGNPIKILNSSLVETGTAVASHDYAFNRALAVSGDGKELYLGGVWNGLGIRHFHSDIPGTFPHDSLSTFGNFEPVGIMDTTLTITMDTTISGTDTTIVADTTTAITQHVDNFWPEDVSLSPDGLHLWAANTQSEWSSERYGSQYWVFNTATEEVEFGLGIQKGDSTAGGIFNGRGVAWSADGNTAYVADFGYNMVTAWVYNPSSIADRPITLPKSFDLMQNFPNPFNPSTSIAYELHQDGMVELTVFDLKGREVATLVNEQMSAGSYTATFNGSNLSSGLYVYQISFNGAVSAKNMMLLK
jgi:hypothetical protein